MTATRKNIRACYVLYDSTYYDVLLAVDDLDEVDDALQEWATNKFSVSNPLDLPTALIWNKDITEVLTTMDTDSYAYMAGLGVAEYNMKIFYSDEIDFKSGLTDQGVCTFTSGGGNLLVNDVAHSMSDDDPIVFTTDTTLPTGLTANVIYYVRDATADTFKLALTMDGTAITYSDAGTGIHHSWVLNKVTIAIENSMIFGLFRFGMVCTSQDGTISGYPTIRYHASDIAANLESPTSHTALTAKGRIYQKESTGNDMINVLANGNLVMADISVAATQSAGSSYKGKFFISGMVLPR